MKPTPFDILCARCAHVGPVTTWLQPEAVRSILNEARYMGGGDARNLLGHEELTEVQRIWSLVPGSYSFDDVLHAIIRGDIGQVPR